MKYFPGTRDRFNLARRYFFCRGHSPLGRHGPTRQGFTCNIFYKGHSLIWLSAALCAPIGKITGHFAGQVIKDPSSDIECLESDQRTVCLHPPTSTSNGWCPVYTASPVWHWESRLQVMTWSLSLSLLHRPQNWGPHTWVSEGFINKKGPKHPIYLLPPCEIRKVINNKCQLHSTLICTKIEQGNSQTNRL